MEQDGGGCAGGEDKDAGWAGNLHWSAAVEVMVARSADYHERDKAIRLH